MALLVLHSTPVATSVFRSLLPGGNKTELPICRGRLHIRNVWQHTDACGNLSYPIGKDSKAY